MIVLSCSMPMTLLLYWLHSADGSSPAPQEGVKLPLPPFAKPNVALENVWCCRMARPGAIKLLSFTCCNEQQTSRNLSASKRTAEPSNSKHQKVKTSRVLEQKVDKCGLTYMIIHGLTKISQVVFFGLYDFTTLRRAAELQYSCNIAPNCVRGSREAAGKHLSARL